MAYSKVATIIGANAYGEQIVVRSDGYDGIYSIYTTYASGQNSWGTIFPEPYRNYSWYSSNYRYRLRIYDDITGTTLGYVTLTPQSGYGKVIGVAGIKVDGSFKADLEQEALNTAPTTPGTFTSPASGTVLRTGETVTIRWGVSSDSDGDSITYDVYAGFNGNASNQNLIGSNLTTNSLSYTLPNNTTYTSVKFGVRAKDSKGAVSSMRDSQSYSITYNSAPSITLATTDNRTLYENDQFNVTGQVTDTDVGNVLTTKYSINGGTERAITATISQGTALTYNKVLTFKQGKLFDGANAITDTLADGSQHVLRVWAEDDKGGKSAEQVRVFYVVANRNAVLTINPVTSVSDLIDSDTIAISGNVSDPDGNTVTVRYKIGNGLYTQVYSGTGGAFTFNVALADLQTGVNTVMVQATDSYGLSTTKTLRVTKNANNKPLLKSVATYKLTPPNGSADGIVLWVQRETGDLIVNAEISMGAKGAVENFVPMVKESTAYVTDAIEEDEFTFDNGEVSAENIVVRLTMERTNASSGNGIKLISGVLS